ncbi:hypothetical protein LTR17_016122 [Elasticomyces elasticus]|nr:hypothetical protein LTR17_016122 [Elasticomyces elasticus]
MASSPAWQDLDDGPSFESCWKRLKSASVQSFAVDFDTSHAHCALDPSQQDIHTLLTRRRHTDGDKEIQETRWFNFWAADRDTEAIKAIAKHYGVSPRLTGLLCSTQATPAKIPPKKDSLQKPNNVSQNSSDADLEKAVGHPDVRPEKPVTQASGFGDVVDKLWHFCSVDRGPRYLYVGFNALFTVPGIDTKLHGDPSKPVGLRIWTSLLLCSDGTVVSVFEKPPPSTPAEYISSMRGNVMNVFRHLSKQAASDPADTLMHVSIRFTEDGDQDATDTAALLFYYLFDDWMTTFSLVTHRNNPYRAKLELLRQEMFETAAVGLIKSLDILGRQLTVLNLVYQSYDLIIHRLLGQSQECLVEAALGEREGNLPGVRALHRLAEEIGVATTDPRRNERHNARNHGICLPTSAVVRFERLLDRIRLHALAEIEECLKQKESLVLMNFNLVALRESHSVEKLTRTTILLAKVTILFLPVSLMTSYFSIQLPDISKLYDLETYWVCFLVVVVLSTLGLVLFGGLSGKVAGRMTYKSFTRTLYERLAVTKAKRP